MDIKVGDKLFTRYSGNSLITPFYGYEVVDIPTYTSHFIGATLKANPVLWEGEEDVEHYILIDLQDPSQPVCCHLSDCGVWEKVN